MTTPLIIEPTPGAEERLAELKDERERAVACAVLSLAISLALLLSNFPGDRTSIENALKSGIEHAKLLADIEQVLKVNEQVLVENQQALVNVRNAAAVPK